MTVSDKRERRGHYRGKARPGRRVQLEYRLAGQDASEQIQAFTRNIGVGGAFIVTNAPADVGTELIVALQVPTAPDTIEVGAEVRWVAGESADGPGGMGVKFADLDVDQLLQLSEYFASLTGTEISLEPG